MFEWLAKSKELKNGKKQKQQYFFIGENVFSA